MREPIPQTVREGVIEKLKLRHSLLNKHLCKEYRIHRSTISKIWKEYLRSLKANEG
jgi:hypothetical protein